jgi:hypothetical protein
MARVFGWQFLFSVFVVYGVQQGMANSWFFQARDYYFKDVAKVCVVYCAGDASLVHLIMPICLLHSICPPQVDPADAQIYTAASQTPWNLKPLYGMTR